MCLGIGRIEILDFDMTTRTMTMGTSIAYRWLFCEICYFNGGYPCITLCGFHGRGYCFDNLIAGLAGPGFKGNPSVIFTLCDLLGELLVLVLLSCYLVACVVVCAMVVLLVLLSSPNFRLNAHFQMCQPLIFPFCFNIYFE